MKLLRGKLAAKKTSPACTAELFPAFLGSFSLDWKPLSFHTAWESQILPSSWDVLCKISLVLTQNQASQYQSKLSGSR